MAVRVQNCDSGVSNGCPVNWENLELTGDSMIRFCGACLRSAIRCESEDEVQARVAAGQLVAAEDDVD